MKIIVIGLGYVGLPIALAFSKKKYTIGFDIDNDKIEMYKKGIDIIGEYGNSVIKKSNINFTSDAKKIKSADFIIVTVPTPIDDCNNPDLSCLISATKIIAKNMKQGAIVVYESTVYPGTTEEICIPILEKESKLVLNKDFYVGYSPERINAGDKNHSFEKINKIVSGSNSDVCHQIKKIYSEVLLSDIIEVSSIKVAEASKIIENAQRDINIAFMNEMSKIFHLMNIDTYEVLAAAKTKWNFLDFVPGLVGGHCIGVDPYYLAAKAKELNYIPEVILSGRKINDSMGKYVAEMVINSLNKNKIKIQNSKIMILGVTFKENVCDIRNSKVIDIVKELSLRGCNVYINDYNTNSKELYEMYGLKLDNDIRNVDVIIVAVKHNKYKKLTIDELLEMYNNNKKKKIIFDLHAIYDKDELERRGFEVWRM